MLRGSLIFAVSVAIAAAAPAAGAMSLNAAVMQEQTVQANGQPVTKLVPAGRVGPGDAVVYVLSFANSGGKRADDVVITNPVPANLQFVDADGAEVSVDGGKAYGALASLRLPAADGSTRLATAADVTHVRWALAPVAPGASGQVSFRARVK
jgi:uncharacterized repeat protein (TIGR01451 family)